MVSITGFATSALEGLNNHIASLHTSEAIIFEMATILIISAIFAFVARILKLIRLEQSSNPKKN
jgi:hypothetical protein